MQSRRPTSTALAFVNAAGKAPAHPICKVVQHLLDKQEKRYYVPHVGVNSKRVVETSVQG